MAIFARHFLDTYQLLKFFNIDATRDAQKNVYMRKCSMFYISFTIVKMTTLE